MASTNIFWVTSKSVCQNVRLLHLSLELKKNNKDMKKSRILWCKAAPLGSRMKNKNKDVKKGRIWEYENMSRE